MKRRHGEALEPKVICNESATSLWQATKSWWLFILQHNLHEPMATENHRSWRHGLFVTEMWSDGCFASHKHRRVRVRPKEGK